MGQFRPIAMTQSHEHEPVVLHLADPRNMSCQLDAKHNMATCLIRADSAAWMISFISLLILTASGFSEYKESEIASSATIRLRSKFPTSRCAKASKRVAAACQS